MLGRDLPISGSNKFYLFNIIIIVYYCHLLGGRGSRTGLLLHRALQLIVEAAEALIVSSAAAAALP